EAAIGARGLRLDDLAPRPEQQTQARRVRDRHRGPVVPFADGLARTVFLLLILAVAARVL
ncbi:hypothetical protein GTZ78_15715, partial [Streptomyces sp. SID8361]|uniref:hypothetical protein n=1 Tax=Streptomyces sp. MnatMP-M27 TaxID=1839768 RepID=UPI00081EDFE3